MKSLLARLFPAQKAQPSVEPLEQRIAPAAIFWDGGGDGKNWNNKDNWSNDTVPTFLDTVTINPAGAIVVTIDAGSQEALSLSVPGDDTLAIQGGSLTLSANSSIAKLAMTGGQLVANGPLALTGASTFNNEATLTGTNVITVSGTLGIESGQPNLLTELRVTGTVNHGNAYLDFASGVAKVRILDGGVYNTVNTSSDYGFRNIVADAPGISVEAGGTFRHNSSNGARFITNTSGGTMLSVTGGTVEVVKGTLGINGPGAWSNAKLTVAADAALNFLSGANIAIGGTFGGAGKGTVNLTDSATLNIPTSATINFPVGSFQWSSDATISGPGVLTNTGFLQIPSGQPNLATELRNSGTIQQGNAYLDFQDSEARLRVLSGGVFETVNTSSDYGFRSITTGALGISVEAGGVFRHNSANGGRFLTNTSGGTMLNVTGGTVEVVKGTLGINGPGAWSNAKLTVASDAALNFLSGANIAIGGTFGGAGKGIVNLTDSSVFRIATAGATFNFPVGSFQWSSDSTISGPGVLTNTGFLQIPSGSPNLATELRNSGTIQQGNAYFDFQTSAARLRVLNGGVFESVNTSSDYGFRNIATDALGISVEAGGVFRHNSPNGARFLTNTSGGTMLNVTGGSVEVVEGTLGINGPGAWSNVKATVASGAALNFLGGANIAIGGTFGGAGKGTVNLTDTSIFRIAATGASFDFPVGSFQWNSDATISGPGVLTNTGFLQIPNGQPNLATELRNTGTIQQSNAYFDFNGPTAQLRILAGGVFESVNTSSDYGFRNLSSNSLGVSVEAGGVFRQNSSNLARFLTNTSGNSIFSVAEGTVEVVKGTLGISGPGAWTNATATVASNAALNFLSDADIALSGTFAGTGAGVVNLTDTSTLRVPDTATLNFPAGSFQWSSNATIAGPGVLTNLGFLQIPSGQPNLTTELRNAGTFQQGNAYFDFQGPAAQLRVLSGGLFQTVNTSSDYGLRNLNGDALGFFVEAGGTVQHNSSNGARFLTNASQDLPFSNLGTVEAIKGTFLIGATNTIVAGGTYIVRSGGTLDLSRNLTSNAGAIVIEGTGNFLGLGALASNSGSLTLLGGADLTTSANFTNTGRLHLGEGSLLTTAAFTQTAAGTVEFEIGGIAPEQFGRFVAHGLATLGGTARVQLASDLSLGAGQFVALANYEAHTGNFARFEGLSLQRTPVFDAVVGDIGIVLNSLVDAADLAVQTVTVPASGTAGQNFAFSYTVKNVSAFSTLAPSWIDTIYLSKDGILSPDDLLFTRTQHTGVLASGASYTQTANLPLVGALPDNYQLIVSADSRGFVPDPDHANNLGASGTTFALDVPTLTAGGSVSGTISSGQDLFFRVNLPQGVTPAFALSGAVNGEAELYTSLGSVPTRGDFDESAFRLDRTSQTIIADVSAAGTYYVLIHGREAAGAGQNFTLSASGLGFDLLSAESARGAALGQVTTTLSGAQFTPGTKFYLVVGGNGEREATAVAFEDANTANATFDLNGLAPGAYSIRARDGAQSDTLAGAFTVVSGGKAGAVHFDLSAPRYIRPPFNGSAVTITYENTGDTDVAAPLFQLFGQNARLRLAGESDFSSNIFTGSGGNKLSVFELLGVSDGLAGVLSPGEKGSIDVIFEPINSGAHALVDFNLLLAGDDNTPLDLSPLKGPFKPANISAEAWNAVFANFQAGAGATLHSYHSMLMDNANYLGQFGAVSPQVAKLLAFELDQADDFGASSQRYENSALGRGNVAPFSLHLSTDTLGNVTLSEGGGARYFAKLSDGTYRTAGGDSGMLTQNSSGAFSLEEVSGKTTVFRASDGRIDYIEDSTGVRVTGDYNAGGQLLSLTNGLTGDVTVFTYNAQGKIATTTDAVGHVSTFGYDASGEQLTSVTTPQGTTSYTYLSGQGAAREHAVSSITTPGGVTTTFTYDALGRVTSRTTGTGADAVALGYTYNGPGQLTVKDAANHTQQYFQGPGGNIVRTVDPLGHSTSANFDAQGRIVGVTDASGLTSKIGYGAQNIANVFTNPDRTHVNFTLDSEAQRIISLTDARGGKATFEHDADGNLLATHQADGATDRYEYDANGRVTAAIDADGARSTFTYNAVGLVTHRSLPGGDGVDFTYDAHRNLLTATDSEGATTFTYDSADRITSVTYPNGKSVTTTYDAQGRRATVADQSGYTVQYSYDALGRIDTLRDAADALLVDYGYDAVGRLASETRGNGSSTAYTYDAGGHTATIVHRDAANAVLAQFAYTYDAQDHVRTATSASGTTTYSYDLNGQLTGVTLPGGRTIAYTYDAEGNRTTVSDSASSAESYTTNSGDAYTSAGGETFTYDTAGRLLTSTKAGVTTAYSYDSNGRLIGVASPGNVVSYDYDALGNRIAKIENGVRTDFALDPTGLGVVFGEYQGATNVNYATGNGIAARSTASGTSFYHFDGSGNTALLTGTNGASVASYQYLPFGEITAQTGSSAQPFTFDGQLGVQDDVGDLFNMRARTYDASLGRFTTRDPLGFAAGDTDLYRFASNDPINHSDASGLIDVFGGIGAELTVGAGLNVQAGGYVNSDDPLDFGFFASPGVGVGLNVGVSGTVGQSEDISGFAVNYNGGLGPVTGTATYDIYGEHQTGVSGGIGVGPLPVGASLTVTHTTKLSARGLLTALGVEPPAKVDRRPEAVLGQTLDSFIQRAGDDSLFRHLVDNNLQAGKTKQDAIQEAISFLKKNNIQDPLVNPNPVVRSEVIRPNDPNNISGPAGPGADPLPELIGPGQTRFDGFVNGSREFDYRIDFENQATASAPAQIVTATQTLSPGLDFSTFHFDSFGFGDFKIDVPADANGTSFHTIYDGALATLGVRVQVDAALNTATGLLQVTFTSLDPATNEVPSNPFAGFLPPNLIGAQGDGYINYSVAPKTGLANGTNFTSIASIVFDTEAAIATPTVINKLDSVAPTSSIVALPANTARDTFVVRYTAADDAAGSGIGGVSVYFTDTLNGVESARQLVGVGNTMGGAPFTGEVGHTYKFFSQAFDAVGNGETLSNTPDAMTTVIAPTFVNVGRNKTFTDADGDRYTIQTTGPGHTKVALVDPDGDGKGAIDFLQIDGSKATSTLSITVQKAAGGDGRVTIGDTIVNGSLGSFTARQSDLVVNGLVATGGVGAIKVHDIGRDPLLTGGNALIDLGGASTLNLNAHNLANGFSLKTAGAISSLHAASIGEGSITAASLGKLLTTAGAMNADLAITGKVGSVSVKTGVDTGDWSARSFGAIAIHRGNLDADLTAVRSIAKITVTGGDLTGDLAANSKIGAISIEKDATGRGGNLLGATITAGKITSLDVAKNVSDSLILAGADLGADHALGGLGEDADTFAPGTIGAVKIKGSFSDSVLAAGLSSSDSIFHNADDAILGGTASRIAALTIKGTVTNGAYFAAGSIKPKIRIAGQVVTAATDPRFLVG